MRSRCPLRERPRRRVIFGVDEGLVEEHQAVRLLAHARLTLGVPDAALIPHVGACALRRHQVLMAWTGRAPGRSMGARDCPAATEPCHDTADHS
jgi:hypothetical protein